MPTLYLAIDARKMKEGAKDAKDASDNVTDATEKTSKSLDKLKERASKAWDILKGLFKAMIAGTTAVFGLAAAFTAFNVATASSINNLAYTAQALQLTVEQVSLLEYAADRAGTNLGEISGAIRAVAAQAQAFASGDEKAIGLFNFLGVDPTGQDPIALTSAVATAIGNVEDKTQKLALSQDLLGRSGFKVIELFKDQGAGFRDVAEDAQRLGAIVDEKLVKIAANLVDTWGDFKKALGGVANEILRSSGPTITKFLKDLSETIAANRFLIGATFGAMADALREVAAIISEGGLSKNFGGLSGLFGEALKTTFVNVTPAALQSAAELGKVIGAALVDGFLTSMKRSLVEDLVNGGIGAQLTRKFLPDTARAEIDRLATLLDQANEIDRIQRNVGGLLGATNPSRDAFEKAIGSNVAALSAQIGQSTGVIRDAWSTAAAGIESDLSNAYAKFLATADGGTREHVENIVKAFSDIPLRAKLQELTAVADERTATLVQGILTGSVINPFDRPEDFLAFVDTVIAKARAARQAAAIGLGIGAPPGSPPLERKDISERLKAIESIERLIRAKEDEIKLIGLSDQEREKAVFGIEAERHAFELSTAEIDRAKDAYGRLVDEITAANKTYQLSRSIAEPIGNGVEEAILHFESLRDVGLSVYEDLRRAAVRSFITNPLIESLTSGINSGLSGLNLFGSARGNVFSGGHVLPFAMGGVLNQASYMPMADGRTAMAGESRSELVVAPIRRTSRGEIGLSVEGTGGQNLTFNMHYHGNGSRQDQDGFRQSARQVVDDAKRRLQI